MSLTKTVDCLLLEGAGKGTQIYYFQHSHCLKSLGILLTFPFFWRRIIHYA